MSTVDVLVVGGGGSGRGNGPAGNSGDGGSAGQLAYTAAVVVASGDIAVTIGLGGVGVANAAGNNGGDSVFGTIIATGGVGGQNTSSTLPRCGGNGAGGAGGVGAAPNAGAGGAGTVDPITGTFFSGGGGGGFSYGGAGGSGGGGRGEDYGTGNALPGAANSGGGGGGVSNTGSVPGKNGGSGIVIIRYITADFRVCAGGAKTVAGIYTIHTFTASGTFTVIPLPIVAFDSQAERLTVIFAITGAPSLPSAIIVVDGKAYTGLWTPGTLYTFTYTLALERGPHIIYGQATDSAGTVTTAPITYVMAYELSDFGIDIYSGDAKLDVIEPLLHDALLPDLPTLNFSCATLLTGTVQAVIRERGLRQYQFTIGTVGYSNGSYTYACLAAESYALTAAIMALQTAYGSTANAISLLVPSLNIVNPELLAQTTYPQLFQNIEPIPVIQQLMIQALAQASVRNGNLYAFPLDVSAQVPNYHMQRLDPLTGWQKDANIYDAVRAHYTVKQYPTPDTVLTLNDAGNWVGTVSNVTQVDTTLLPVPSGALGMLKSVGNASRAGLSTLFKYFDRIRFNWNPVTATSVTVSLQQDASNKLELVHTFAGQMGAGFILQGAPGVTGDTLTKNITLAPVQFVTTVTGTTTANCSYRVTLLNAGGAPIWQDVWRSTIGNTFEADVPTSVSQVYQATTVRIEFTSLYLIAANYGVQCVTCYIQVQSYNNVGSHVSVVSSVTHSVPIYCGNPSHDYYHGTLVLPALTGSQWYEAICNAVPPLTMGVSANAIYLWDFEGGYRYNVYYPNTVYRDVTAVLKETVQDYAWISSYFMWSPAFNLFEAVDIPFVAMTRTGNPVNLQTIVMTFTGDNYLDTLVLVADNTLPITVQAGTGARVYPVTEDFGSQAGAQAYADGLLPIISVAREQYTRDLPLGVDLGVGDTVDGDGTPMTVYAADYRQDGKTIAAGRAMDTLMTRLAEQARRTDALERKG